MWEKMIDFCLSSKAENIEQLVGQKGIEGCHIKVEYIKKFIGLVLGTDWQGQDINKRIKALAGKGLI